MKKKIYLPLYYILLNLDFIFNDFIKFHLLPLNFFNKNEIRLLIIYSNL